MKIKYIKYFALFFLLISVGCQEEVLSPPKINLNLPEIHSIQSDSKTVLIGKPTQVSVGIVNGSSYEWSAPAGTFSDPKANPTTWNAPQEAGNYTLTCAVTNSSGTSKASITLQVIESTVPNGASAYWSFDKDFSEEVSETSGEGGTGVSITNDSQIGDGAALFEGEEAEIESALLYSEADAPMGPDDQFTIAVWVKTEDVELGYVFGRTFDGVHSQGAKGIYLEEGGVFFDVSWVGGWGEEEVFVNDGEWHHIAVVKTDSELLIYVDGEEMSSGEIEDWTPDDGTTVTIGAAWEEEGAEWPGTFQGSMDDLRFYPTALSADEIASIASRE